MTNKKKHLNPCVEDHNIIVSQVVLAKVWTLLRHGEVSWSTTLNHYTTTKKTRTFLIWASEKPGIVHEVSLLLISLLLSKSHPEEVLRLLSFVQYLQLVFIRFSDFQFLPEGWSFQCHRDCKQSPQRQWPPLDRLWTQSKHTQCPVCLQHRMAPFHFAS